MNNRNDQRCAVPFRRCTTRVWRHPVYLYTACDLWLPGGTESIVQATMARKTDALFHDGRYSGSKHFGIITPMPSNGRFQVGHAVTNLVKGRSLFKICNVYPEQQFVRKNTRVAVFEPTMRSEVDLRPLDIRTFDQAATNGQSPAASEFRYHPTAAVNTLIQQCMNGDNDVDFTRDITTALQALSVLDNLEDSAEFPLRDDSDILWPTGSQPASPPSSPVSTGQSQVPPGPADTSSTEAATPQANSTDVAPTDETAYICPRVRTPEHGSVQALQRAQKTSLPDRFPTNVRPDSDPPSTTGTRRVNCHGAPASGAKPRSGEESTEGALGQEVYKDGHQPNTDEGCLRNGCEQRNPIPRQLEHFHHDSAPTPPTERHKKLSTCHEVRSGSTRVPGATKCPTPRPPSRKTGFEQTLEHVRKSDAQIPNINPHYEECSERSKATPARVSLPEADAATRSRNGERHSTPVGAASVFHLDRPPDIGRSCLEHDCNQIIDTQSQPAEPLCIRPSRAVTEDHSPCPGRHSNVLATSADLKRAGPTQATSPTQTTSSPTVLHEHDGAGANHMGGVTGCQIHDDDAACDLITRTAPVALSLVNVRTPNNEHIQLISKILAPSRRVTPGQHLHFKRPDGLRASVYDACVESDIAIADLPKSHQSGSNNATYVRSERRES